MPEPVNNLLYNSARWDGFAFREGDIIIATPGKCGTTWIQRIVSLLIFDSPELPAPMAKLSPWLDMNTRAIDDVLGDLEAQTHRRFVKSHLDYSLLPHHNDVTYISSGRDPRDVAISWAHHIDNVNFEALFAQRAAAVGMDDLADMAPEGAPLMTGSLRDRTWAWLDDAASGLGGLVGHVRSFWDERDQPNVVVLHYADLQADLVGQMVGLAARLGIERSRERIEELAAYASFEAMKNDAPNTAPNSDQGLWLDTSNFFASGTSGQWRDVLTDPGDEARFAQTMANAADPELAAWLVAGSAATDRVGRH